ncbi:MAG: hypothetical protein LBF27_25350 [Sphingobacterium sp.]|jgi:hypothetical protein|nr:hypothetical protein [Sphingobacterium sp.]
MKTLENINLTTEFTQFCDIFNFTPEEVVQEFINKIDIVQYLCDFLDPDRWANLFAMEYMIHYTQSEERLRECDEFGEQWGKMMVAGGDDLVGKTKDLLDKWHKKVLEERIQDIIKRDKEENT